MKKSVSRLSNLLLSSTLFLGVPMALGEELASSKVLKVPVNEASYCHIKFPPMHEETLSWARPVLDEDTTEAIDFYGPCDYDPVGTEEIRAQRHGILRGASDDSE